MLTLNKYLTKECITVSHGITMLNYSLPPFLEHILLGSAMWPFFGQWGASGRDTSHFWTANGSGTAGLGSALCFCPLPQGCVLRWGLLLWSEENEMPTQRQPTILSRATVHQLLSCCIMNKWMNKWMSAGVSRLDWGVLLPWQKPEIGGIRCIISPEWWHTFLRFLFVAKAESR